MRHCWKKKTASPVVVTTMVTTTRRHSVVVTTGYRIVDFKRNKDISLRQQKRLNMIQTAPLTSLALWRADGERRYILAPKA